MGSHVVKDVAQLSGAAKELPRGGFLVSTPSGRIQVGAPPATIKDTIVTEESVPQVFVLPVELFNWQKGINVADMEFPIYFNFFIRQQKTTVICTEEQGRRLAVAMSEAVFGPKSVDLKNDAFQADDDVFVPDIRGELAFFRRGLKLSDMLEIKTFDKKYRISHSGISIARTESDSFRFSSDGNQIAEVPARVHYTPQYNIGEQLPEPFIPPRFGVTCLGPSNGFDPKDNTSGFIIWLNGNGIMVDPPVNSTEWLVRSNVNPKFIDSIILTHCHADHDAGTFQKILEESKVTIYTTPTIMRSFLTKYAAFSGESFEYLRRLFTFHPVYIGRSFYLHGGQFYINYALHSIPTMGFRLTFQDKTFVYSSDHQGDPEVQKELREKEIISQRRLEELQSFPWDSDVIYHEAGIPPLHTPVSYLNSLPKSVQKKVVVYHIAAKDFPSKQETALTRATFGIENTLYFDVKAPAYEEAYRSLDVLKHLDFFTALPVAKVQQFLTIVEGKRFKRGQKIIEKGQKGEYFFIIRSGNARVDTDQLLRSKYLGAYEYFGEVALLTGALRSANIVAVTDVEAYAISKSRFINFIAGTEFERVLQRLIRNRSEETWNLLVTSPFFAHLTDYQRMWLESVLVPEERDGAGLIVREGEQLPGIYIIRKGTVEVSRKSKPVASLGDGEVIGMMNRIQRGLPADFTFRHRGPLSVFHISLEDTQEFLSRNPGTAMRLSYGF